MASYRLVPLRLFRVQQGWITLKDSAQEETDKPIHKIHVCGRSCSLYNKSINLNFSDAQPYAML